MSEEEKVYRELQKHLDRQAVGYPATKSGVELKILKRIFNKDEARLAMHLTYKPRSVEHIYETAKEMGLSLNHTENMLDAMMKNGAIGHIEREGKRYFCNIPFAIGMYEGQLNKLTPEFIEEIDEYTGGNSFGLAFLGTELPQMRTIPVRESIPLSYQVTNYNHMTDIINNNDGPIVILECICRQKAAILGNPCQQTTRLETCMALGDMANNLVMSGIGREISKEEALEITRQNEADGLVLQPSNTQKVEFVCACCGCCCGMLTIHKMLPKPVEFWSTNYYNKVDSEKCDGCATCVTRCQVNALSIDERLNVAKVNLDRCIGCGNCIVSCPSEALSLTKKEKETIPPVDSESLYDIIMANKKGLLGKMKLAARIMLKI
ncbi:MAG TPA: 4Fe-4S binding protein [Dehalococcoidia bacterium]|nr:4Fe-4S binding protein [Dehalococcoidia bacterium]